MNPRLFSDMNFEYEKLGLDISRVCLSQTKSAAGDCRGQTRSQNRNISDEGGESGAGHAVYILLQSCKKFVKRSLQLFWEFWHRPSSPNALESRCLSTLTSSSVSSRVWGLFVILRYLYSSSFATARNNFFLLYSHIYSFVATDVCTFVFSHIDPQENFGKMSSACAESSSRDVGAPLTS